MRHLYEEMDGTEDEIYSRVWDRARRPVGHVQANTQQPVHAQVYLSVWHVVLASVARAGEG